jgi:hypothetical protein
LFVVEYFPVAMWMKVSTVADCAALSACCSSLSLPTQTVVLADANVARQTSTATAKTLPDLARLVFMIIASPPRTKQYTQATAKSGQRLFMSDHERNPSDSARSAAAACGRNRSAASVP